MLRNEKVSEVKKSVASHFINVHSIRVLNNQVILEYSDYGDVANGGECKTATYTSEHAQQMIKGGIEFKRK